MHFSTLCGNFDSTWAKDFSHMQFSRHNVRILHYSKQLKFCIKYHFWWHPRTYGSNNMLFLHSCSKEWRRAEAQSSLFHGPMRRWKCLFSPWHLSNRRSTAWPPTHPQQNLKKGPKPSLWSWCWGWPSYLAPQCSPGCGRSAGAGLEPLPHAQRMDRSAPALPGPESQPGEHQGPFFNSEHSFSPSSSAARETLIGVLVGWVCSRGKCMNPEYFCHMNISVALPPSRH